MDIETTPTSPRDPAAAAEPSDPAGHSRRTVLRAAGGIGLLGIAAAVGGATAFGQDTGTTDASGLSPLRELAAQSGTSCVDLTPEVTEGPFYLPNELIRKDIREGEPGFALALTFRVMNSLTCRPIKRAAVDIWHCNATGVYSGVAQEAEGETPADSNTFLRGIQLTDTQGRCTITTIIPGWYPGRAVHIHLKVHVGGSVSHHHYVGGRVVNTGQVFFSESLLGRIEDLSPYDEDSAPRQPNDSDQIYHQAGGKSAIVQTRAVVKGDPTKGYTGRMVLGIDPSAQG